jgi:carboxymethylenebutenolidase
MCHESDARAPPPPIAGASDVARSADIVLRSSDGTEFAAFEALTSHDGAPGIVILPDVRGLHPFYRDLAMRSAEAGMHAVAIDYFGRTAGLGERNEDFDHMAHVRQTTPDGVARDVSAAVERLRSETAATRLYTMGFCFGGRKSFNQAARREGLDGVIGFYGLPQGRGEDDVDHRLSSPASTDARCSASSAARIRRSRLTPWMRSVPLSTPPTCRTSS